MLLLTDRLHQSGSLHQTLAQVQSCTIVGLHQTTTFVPTSSLIVCDAVINHMATVELLQSALLRYRASPAVPMLYLARDPSHLTLAQARRLGATEVLPYDTKPAQLLPVVRKLLDGQAPVAAKRRTDTIEMQASVRGAGAALAELLNAAKRRKPLSLAMLDQGATIVLSAIEQAEIRSWLDVVWNYDDLTYQHCLLVAGLVASFALELGLTRNQQCLLSQAALVHDIGKAHVPIAILNKPSQLSIAETTIIRTHASMGHALLVAQGCFSPHLLSIVRHHHEYLDGSGYPDGLREDKISRFVRLVTICDIYAALIERRSYKTPIAPQKAFALLQSMGPKLDASLLNAFRNVVGQQ